MSLESRWTRVVVGAIGLFARCVTCAVQQQQTAALSVTPSTNWYGDDGSWSAVSIRVGSPQQWLDVLVNTVSSETWVPGAGSCVSNDTLCVTNKGGLFRPIKSSTWQEQGFFDLGVDYQLGNDAYAEYGLDDLTFGTTGVKIPASIIGAFNGSGPTNGSSYFNGFFGVGITPGNFTNVTPLCAISALVEQLGLIPSHSYGYTAGAYYRLKGVLNSLTLGGYDANRFIPHDTRFTLSSSKTPQAFINSITVSSPSTSRSAATTVSLLSSVDMVTAVIDSSTPFLWLPGPVCDRFASTLGLSYNASLNLYTFDSNASQHDILAASQLSFTFSLSDYGASPNLVNITLPYAAFDLKLIYPAIPNTNYGDSEATKYYFPLRQAQNSAQYTIGRAFLQEAYIITDYERNLFSVHQAVHVLDSVYNTSIVDINRPSSSTLTGNPSGALSDDNNTQFPKGAVIGIALGATALATLSITICFLLYRRRRRPAFVSDDKVYDAPPPKRTFRERVKQRRQRPEPAIEPPGSDLHPVEAAGDQIYELPAPLEPVELESESGETMDGSTQGGYATQDSSGLSEYERARRKLERLQNATLIQTHLAEHPISTEKQEQDVSPIAHYRPAESSTHLDSPAIDSPMVSPMAAEFGSLLGIRSGHPSPVSPCFPTNVQTPLSPPPTYRRIDPDHVVYSGPLPDNVQLPSLIPQILGPDGRFVHDAANVPSNNHYNIRDSRESLGSQYTIQEQAGELDLYNGDTPPALSPVGNNSLGTGTHGSDLVSPIASASSGSMSIAHTFGHNSYSHTIEMDRLRTDGSTNASERRTPGGEDLELVHVPQMAENRYSWESAHDEHSI